MREDCRKIAQFDSGPRPPPPRPSKRGAGAVSGLCRKQKTGAPLEHRPTLTIDGLPVEFAHLEPLDPILDAPRGRLPAGARGRLERAAVLGLGRRRGKGRGRADGVRAAAKVALASGCRSRVAVGQRRTGGEKWEWLGGGGRGVGGAHLVREGDQACPLAHHRARARAEAREERAYKGRLVGALRLRTAREARAPARKRRVARGREGARGSAAPAAHSRGRRRATGGSGPP